MLFATMRSTPDLASQGWARFLAKAIDGLFVSLLSVAPSLISADLAFVWRESLTSLGWLGASAVGWLSYIAAFILFDSALLMIFGATPGRALLGLRVVQAEGGQRPTFGQALWRNAMLWTRGLGLGLPIVSLVAMGLAWTTLLKTGSTSWDSASESKVLQVAVHPLRWWLGIAVFVVLIAFRAFTALVAGASPV